MIDYLHEKGKGLLIVLHRSEYADIASPRHVPDEVKIDIEDRGDIICGIIPAEQYRDIDHATVIIDEIRGRLGLD